MFYYYNNNYEIVLESSIELYDSEGLSFIESDTLPTHLHYYKAQVDPIEYKRESLRRLREEECFPIINRGKLWYDSLSDIQLEELKIWYKKWLDVTNTLEVPSKLVFI